MNSRDINSIALIITGCIQPNPNQILAIKDKDTRLMQYIDSIRFYIDDSLFTKIIFCDNSNCSDKSIICLKEYASDKKKIFEYLTFRGNEEIVLKYSNKGCGEDEIMEYIFSNSRLIKTVDSFFKVTGRLKLININEILSKSRIGKNYFLRDLYGGFHWLDTRFYILTKDYYIKNVNRCYDRVNDFSLPYEVVFFSLIKHYRGLAYYPLVKGISGGNNHVYDNDRGFLFYCCNALCRLGLYNRFFPFILLIKNGINKIMR